MGKTQTYQHASASTSQTNEYHGPRFFFLGAGFSVPAGLPVANALLPKVLDEIASLQSPEEASFLHGALDDYLQFRRDTIGTKTTVEVDIEKFGTYLDYQHSLGLRGGDTWAEDGNRDQFLLRWGIGRVLHGLTPQILPPIYLEFARRLAPGDVIVTFNYDLLVERALHAVGKRFRRIPHRDIETTHFSSTIDTDTEEGEVLLLKVHGSLDWVSRGSFDQQLDTMRAMQGAAGVRTIERNDSVFGINPCTKTHPLLGGVRRSPDPLADIEVIEQCDSYYSCYKAAFQHPPLILTPSHTKQLYGHIIHEFWYGLGQSGWALSGLVIIGCSLPPDDVYTRQVLWELAGGYVRGLTDPKWKVGPMNRILVVDKRSEKRDIKQFKQAYRFLPRKYTTYDFDGFSATSLDTMFATHLT